jgi:hypothetical protein
LLALAGLAGSAWSQNYVFGTNVRVNDDSPGIRDHDLTSPGQHVIACRGDTVYLVWCDDRDGEYRVYFARSNNAGQSFLPNVAVTTGPLYSGEMPGLAVDDNGGIHVCWNNYNPDNCNFT